MDEEKSGLQNMKSTIEQLRDELKLKAHLGKADAQEELEKLDRKWDDFLTQYKPMAKEAGKTMESTGEALGLAAEELKAGYERIRKLF